MQLVSSRTSACYGCINLSIWTNKLTSGQVWMSAWFEGCLPDLNVLRYCFQFLGEDGHLVVEVLVFLNRWTRENDWLIGTLRMGNTIPNWRRRALEVFLLNKISYLPVDLDTVAGAWHSWIAVAWEDCSFSTEATTAELVATGTRAFRQAAPEQVGSWGKTERFFAFARWWAPSIVWQHQLQSG